MKKDYLRYYIIFILSIALLLVLLSVAGSSSSAEEVVIGGYADYVAPAPTASASGDSGPATFADKVAEINGVINGFAWGLVMCAFLVGTGMAYTILMKGFQFGKFGHMWRNTIGKMFKKKETEDDKGAITPFQALTTAMAATVGTGNIAGVTGAIVLGGPGAVFWMWVSALFGMATKYAEVVLAIKYRERNDKGEWVGGPMYYIKNGLGKSWKWLAAIFAAFGAVAAFGIGNMSQTNSIAGSVLKAIDSVTATTLTGSSAEPTIRLIVGIVVAAFVGAVVIGGVKRIGKVTEKLVPFMAMFYVIGALVIVFANIGSLGTVFSSIFKSAFAPNAVVGGVGGFMFMNAVKRGVGRGVFSNEAGLGSAPIAHASSSETDPVKQGLYGIFEVFMDTIVICTLTTLVVLISGITVPWGNSALAGADTTTNAFATIFGPSFASIFIAIALICFASSTILSWQLYGERCIGYLTKGKGIKVYQIVFILMIIVGAVMKLQLAWDISETLNGLMAIPNLIAIILLSGEVIKLTKEYVAKIKK